MIDYHSHILPQMDDGSQSMEESLEMLHQSFCQGVDVMVSTCHFYADEEDPKHFVDRRNQAFFRLRDAMATRAEAYPVIVLGAEVLYFPGIAEAEDIGMLTIGCRNSILVEPPMMPWSDSMLDEIAQLGENLGCRPVIAHVNRFMEHLHDETLIDRVLEREMLVQVNANYFLKPKTVKAAIRNLKNGKIHLIGSDCHNLISRPPNLGPVRRLMRVYRTEAEFSILEQNAASLLFPGGTL